MNIVKLSDYRKPKTYEDLNPDKKIFCCARCDSDKFKLWVCGVITCGRCGVVQKDIRVKRD